MASNFVRMVLVVGVFGLAGPPIGGPIIWAITCIGAGGGGMLGARAPAAGD